MLSHLRRNAPYLAVFAIAAYLYFLTREIDFAAPGGRIGPDFWPKAILLLAMAACAYEIAKNLLFGKTARELAGVLQSIVAEAPVETSAVPEEEQRTYPHLLLIGIAMTVAYVLLIERLGFFLCTFIYLAGFTLVGRYRRIGVVLASSLIGSLVFMFVFMKIVYVSLPLGQAPFSEVSFFLMRLMGIR
ncbi:MAG: tripartite tricarboxylate transporter TctB family protein [Betaproteobacteria bacterium]|nr:tripartite tricarboxylate transporter TctB family protein [Betaproteobacteria bacterium]